MVELQSMGVCTFKLEETGSKHRSRSLELFVFTFHRYRV